MAKKKKIDLHLWIGIFIIIIGVLPFLGIRTGIFAQLINALTIVSGIVIVATTR